MMHVLGNLHAVERALLEALGQIDEPAKIALAVRLEEIPDRAAGFERRAFTPDLLAAPARP